MAEIERKFLVASMPPDGAVRRRRAIAQGYLAMDEGSEVRLRRIGDRRVLTVKGGSGLVRDEVEIDLDVGQFDALWPASAGRRLSKSRLEVPLGELVAELDVYEEELAGLATVEVEFPSEERAAAFRPPGWFGAEVTGDPRYRNQSLAVHGRPPAAPERSEDG